MKNARTFKILVVEDSPDIQKAYARVFGDIDPRYRTYRAMTVSEGIDLLEKHPDVDAIVVDGQLVGDEKGMDFVRLARRAGYRGLMVAASTAYNDELVAAGCDHRVDEKFRVPKTVHALINEEMERSKRPT